MMNKKMPNFILASASPARLRLLQNVGINPLVLPSNYDESQVNISDPKELVKTLALRKGETVAAQQTEGLVLSCDSVLAMEGEIYGKPADAAEAIARWQKMRSKVGELLTGHALIDLQQGKTLVRYQVSEVYFADISDRQIAAYVATGEPLKCAGCFALEGKGGLFIEKISGCYSNVIGLSLPLLRRMLDELGYNVTDFWSF
ncbi:nucleoside triphosphate pyrophosphatase [Aerosakkonemataceae cyanobacterium BLCC-F167]|uniref:Nucleoside triphosphate pyrophosphatase n=2 Tax=Floridanema TaxID=3396149 RepID=A0ABV4WVR1_9CYAN